MAKQLTIVIISYNARNRIGDCLESVFHQNYPKSKYKVVVIDNDSKDSTVEYVREEFPEVKVIENRRNSGFAEGNNYGHFLAEKQGSEYLVLLNDDTVVEPNWLKHMTGVLESQKDIGAVQAKLLLHPKTHLINSFGNSFHYLGFGFCNKYLEKNEQDVVEPFEVPYASGAAVVLKMEAIKKAGGLFSDDFFMYHEDADLGWRLRLAGYKVMLDPLAVVYHKYNFSKAKYKFYYMERNRLMVLLQNYKVVTLLLMLPMIILMEIGQWLYSLKNGWFMEKLKGYGWLILHSPFILSRRLNVQFKIRKTTEKDILKLFCSTIKNPEVKSPLLNFVVNPLMAVYFWIVKKVIFW